MQRVAALPSVLDAGIVSAVPFRGTDFRAVLHAVGQTRTVVGNRRFVDAVSSSARRLYTTCCRRSLPGSSAEPAVCPRGARFGSAPARSHERRDANDVDLRLVPVGEARHAYLCVRPAAWMGLQIRGQHGANCAFGLGATVCRSIDRQAGHVGAHGAARLGLEDNRIASARIRTNLTRSRLNEAAGTSGSRSHAGSSNLLHS